VRRLGATRHTRGTSASLALAGAALFCWIAVPAAPAAGKAAPLRFHLDKVHDPLSNGIEAFRMLVPNGWVRTGGVVWNLQWSNVASVVIRVRNSKTHEALESFPVVPQVWQPGSTLPVGTNYLGMQVRPPVGAVAMLEQLIVPDFRGGLHPHVVAATRLPKVARAFEATGQGPTTSSRYDAARVRIAYRENGRAMEEDFYTAVSYTQSPSLPGTTLWEPALLYSFKAPKGKLDGAAGVLQTMISSVQPSLKWYAGYQYVFNLWIQGQMQSIRAAGALSQSIASASDSITKATTDAWQSQQDAYDRIYGEIDNQIRGVDSYRNPFDDSSVELPNEYSYAWVSSSGDYALSNSAGFDPNVGSTIQWRQLKLTK
jgi:hypothetical protein